MKWADLNYLEFDSIVEHEIYLGFDVQILFAVFIYMVEMFIFTLNKKSNILESNFYMNVRFQLELFYSVEKKLLFHKLQSNFCLN